MEYIIPIVIGGIILILFIFMIVVIKRYRKVGPNHALIVYGKGGKGVDASGRVASYGFRVVKGGGTFVWPFIEDYHILSLEIMTIDVTTPEVYTVTGVPIIVDGVAQIKVHGEESAIRTAAEQFLSKSLQEIRDVGQQTLEGHLRAILGTMTVESIYKNRDEFAQKVQEVAATDMGSMGLEIVSFTLRDIRDSHGYLDALGKPRTAEVKRDAIVGQALADRDATIKSAEAHRDAQEKKFEADTKIAEYQRDYEMKKADYQGNINDRRAEADLAYDLQKYRKGQEVKKEEIQVEVIEKQELVKVQEFEILRKEKELDATIKRPADAEKYRIETMANAERFREINEADGRATAAEKMGIGEAEATKAKGLAEAEVKKQIGLAEAEVIKQQGLSEAEAMAKKAESWKMYNEAAITQLFLEKLPELASAISAPLAKTEKIVVVNSGGNGNSGAGASKVTQDVVDIAAQLPPMMEALTGVQLQNLLKKIPGLNPQGQAQSKHGGE